MTNKMPVVGTKYKSKENGNHFEVEKCYQLHEGNLEIRLRNTDTENFSGNYNGVLYLLDQLFEELPEDNLQEACPIETAEAAWNMSEKPAEVIMDYMEKRINQIDETRKDFKAKYPDLLPDAETKKEEVSEVERALEELKKQINRSTPTNSDYEFEYPKNLRCSKFEYEKMVYAADLSWMVSKAKDLINALETEKKEELSKEMKTAFNSVKERRIYNDAWGKGYDAAIEDCRLQKELVDMSKPEPKIDIKATDDSDTPKTNNSGVSDYTSIIEQLQKNIEELKKCQK